ncbi:hypothetical protein HDV02_004236 [Globomyces sp. JEL0801]|nr:hypothetical protein HDV02_004236 [Globomyces sp. JEL0801]
MRLDEYQKRQSIVNRFKITHKLVESSTDYNELLCRCKICKSFCYLSSIKCPQHPETLLCLSHTDVELEICSSKPSKRVLEIRFTKEALDELQIKINVRVSSDWFQLLEDLYKQQPYPTLEQLNEILKAAQQIHLDISETKDLALFIQSCQSWCDRVSKALKQVFIRPRRRREPLASRFSKKWIRPITIDTIESLLDEKKSLRFDAPELPELVKLSKMLTQLKSRVELALYNHETIPIGNLMRLSEQFMDLRIEDPIVNQLNRLIKKKKLSQKYSEMDNLNQYTFEELSDFVKDAQLVGVEAKILEPMRLKLSQRYSEMDNLNQYTFEELSDFVKEAQMVGVEANILEPMRLCLSEIQSLNDRTREQLENSELTLKDLESMVLNSSGLITTTKQLVNQVYTSLQRVQAYLDRPLLQSFQSLSEANADDIDGIIDFIESCKKIPLPKTHLNLLLKKCNESRLWEYELKSMYNAGSDNYLDHLNESISIASRSNEDEVCICNNAKSTCSLLRCTVCKMEYHRECLKSNKRELQNELICLCCQQIHFYNPKNYPSLEAVTAHLAQALKNPLINPDAVHLAKLLLRLKDWQERYGKEYTSGKGKLSNTKLLEYLRRDWSIPLQLPTSSFLLNIGETNPKEKTISRSNKRNSETPPLTDLSCTTLLGNRRVNLKKRKMNPVGTGTSPMQPNRNGKHDDHNRDKTTLDIYSDHDIPLSCENRNTEVFQMLLKDGRLDPSADDNCIIKLASAKGHAEIVQLLLKHDRVDPSAADNCAIKSASAEGHTEIVKMLLKDVRVEPAADDNYCIRVACENGHTDIVRVLLKNKRVDPSAKSNFAIRLASEKGKTEVVKILLNDERVDPSALENYPIRYASVNGYTEIVKLLLKDERVDPCAYNNYALRFACKYGFTEIVRMLLKDERINPSADGFFAIRIASKNGHIELVRMLLEDRRVDRSAYDSLIANITTRI